MKKLILAFYFALGFFSFQLNAQTLNNIESVEYDPVNDQFLISNGSSIIAQDYTSNALSLFGSARASHGMEVIGENIFVIDGATIRGYSLNDASEIMTLPIAGAQFLNGLTSDKTNMLYATDFSKRQILAIDVTDFTNPSFEVLINNTQLTPNGIHFDQTNERLVFVTWGPNASVRSIDLSDLSIEVLATTSYGNMDGIVQDKDDNYYISTWNPARIIKLDPAFANPIEEVSLPTNLFSPADIGIAIEKDIIGIPHYPFNGDEVVFLDLDFSGEVSTDDLISLGLKEVTITPIPANTYMDISLNLTQSKHLEVVLLDVSGRMIKTLANQEFSAGEQIFTTHFSPLAKGQYYVQIKSDIAQATYPVSFQ